MSSNKVGFSHENRGSQNVDWYTPKWIFDSMGIEFDLDPCQPETGVPWIPAKRFYSLKDDGLVSPWHGRVWLNPPYGKHTGRWLAKMNEHRNGVCLVFARTDCAWFHDYVVNADAILFLRGRVKFVDGLGVTSGGGAGCGSMLVAWGAESAAAVKRLADKGKFLGRRYASTSP